LYLHKKKKKDEEGEFSQKYMESQILNLNQIHSQEDINNISSQEHTNVDFVSKFKKNSKENPSQEILSQSLNKNLTQNEFKSQNLESQIFGGKQDMSPIVIESQNDNENLGNNKIISIESSTESSLEYDKINSRRTVLDIKKVYHVEQKKEKKKKKL